MFERLGGARPAFCGYLTVGYPHRDSTPDIAAAIVDAGVDMIELGIPFSDPLGEGRTIQRTSQAALRNGVSTAFCLETTRLVRQAVDVPLVLMGYINPILAYGVEAFCEAAAEAGADGLIVVDIAIEEMEGLHRAARAAGLDLVLLVAPTSTDERIAMVARLASGFIYCIAVTGVTGSREQVGQDVEGLLARVRAHTNVPLGLGFGLSRPEHIRNLAGKVDAAIVGSALLDAITAEAPGASAAGFVRWMLDAPGGS